MVVRSNADPGVAVRPSEAARRNVSGGVGLPEWSAVREVFPGEGDSTDETEGDLAGALDTGDELPGGGDSA